MIFLRPVRCLSSALLALLVLSSPAWAVTHTVSIYLDLDDDTSTGCDVATVEGVFAGAEQVLISTVETTSGPEAGVVTDVAVADCIDEMAGTFGIPVSFDGNWPVGVANGVAGRDVVETYVPLVYLVIQNPTTVHLGVVVTDEQDGEQALITDDGTPEGDPIVLSLASILEIPTVSEWGALLLILLLIALAFRALSRRETTVFLVLLALAGASGAVWAAGTLDGLVDDWTTADQLGSNGIVLFGKAAPDQLCFRVDVDLLFNQPPTISDIADQTIPEDGTTGALAFTVGDAESPANTLTVTATSSNQFLVPDANLTLEIALNRVDEVLYAAKDGGRNTVMQSSALINHIRRATSAEIIKLR